MLRDISPQSIFMGLLAGFVGTASSFAVVLQGLTSVGATPETGCIGSYGAIGFHGALCYCLIA